MTPTHLRHRRFVIALAVLLCAGPGAALAQISFGPVRPYLGRIGRITSADLDGDNDIDLITDDGGSGHIAVLSNNGDGTFAAPVEYLIPTGTNALVAADLNGDTHVDLVLARAGVFPTGDGIISVLLNDGLGNFGPVIDFSVIVSPVVGQQLTPLALAAGDFDGNGTVDVATACVLLNQIGQEGYFSVISNLGNDGLAQPTFGSSVNIDALQAFTRDIVAGDFDNDLDVDVAVVSSLSNATNSVSVILNNGDGTFGAVNNERLGGAATTALSLVLGEVNGDGFIDMVTINGQHTYSVVLNLAGGINPAKAGLFKDVGQFPLGSQALPATDIPTGGAALRDLDGDGDQDLIAGLSGDSGPGSLAVFVNPGTGVFGLEMTNGPCFDYRNLVAEDLDGDGDIDVASADPSTFRILVLLNELIPAVPAIGDATDADGDGVPDCDDGCPLDPTKSQPGLCGCAGSFIVVPCDDGDACTTGDACSSGVCVSGFPTVCDDGNVCTDDSCNSATGCINAPVVDRACSDGDVCTVTDTCSAVGVCVGAGALDCDDSNACTDDSCDPAGGCSNVANTAPCDDGDACTTGDVCAMSVCASGAPTVCEDNNGCTDDSCDSVTGCVNAPIMGRVCDDGNACTVTDQCNAAGMCIAGPGLNCDDGNVCTDDSCDITAGCSNVANTAPCNDGDACTTNDTCSATVCVGGPLLDCDDTNICTDDSCAPLTGCSNVANTAPCNDGDACTTADTCSATLCVGGPPPVCDDSNVCTDDTCDPTTGCVQTPVSGRVCDDANTCTPTDTCDAAGVCVGAGALDCDDGNVCTDDSCDSATGCSNVANTAACDDGDACTTADTCALTMCVGGAAPDCDDSNGCTDDSCDSVNGCVNSAVLGRVCDDGNACTETDACDSLGVCIGGAGPNCDDMNPCTDDSCDMVTGCSNVPNTAPCDDGDACTTGGTCSAGACISGPPVNCDDTNVCTDDSCDSLTGCVNMANTAACDDGDVCTTSDTCEAGACVGGPQLDCDDSNVCTDDACDVVAGCSNVANTAPCDDGNACTTGDVCASTMCLSGSPTVCDDGNECTDDTCDTLTGCLNAPAAGRACDDADVCTEADTCDATGVCVGGAGLNCDDGNVCTDDLCDATTGCQNVVVSSRVCDDGIDCTSNDICSTLGECVGDGSACGPATIPAASTWGLAIMLLLLLTAGTLILARTQDKVRLS